MLGRELGGRRDLDLVGVPERALRERREPAQRLDLDVEQVDAHGAVLGRRVDVEQPAADGELTAVVDLVDALVAGGDELGDALVEVEQLADAQPERVRAQRRVGHLLAQRDGGHDDDRRVVARGARFRLQQRVERRDAQADEVRRRREMRLVGDAAAGVEAHRPRVQPGAQVGREVARLAVVAGDDQRRPHALLVGQRGQHVGPQRRRDEGAPPSRASVAPSASSVRWESSGRRVMAGEATAGGVRRRTLQCRSDPLAAGVVSTLSSGGYQRW